MRLWRVHGARPADRHGTARQAILVSSLYTLFASGVGKLRAGGLDFASGELLFADVPAQSGDAIIVGPALRAWLTNLFAARSRCAVLGAATLLFEAASPPLVTPLRSRPRTANRLPLIATAATAATN